MKKPAKDILSKSADCEAMLDYWNFVNTVIEGVDAMRKAGSTYLKQLPKEDDTTYLFRLANVTMTNVYGDIIDNLSSKPFSSPIVVDGDKQAIEFADDVDGSGNDISTFIGDVFYHALNDAVSFIFVDFNKVQSDRSLSIAEAEALGNRPYWTRINAANVLDIKSRMSNGREEIYYIKMYEPAADGKFVRILSAANGVVAFELWKETEDKQEFELIDSGVLTIPLIPIVPVITGRRAGKKWRFKPILKDAADLQLHLYRKENDLNWSEIMSCFVMIAAQGVKVPRDARGDPIPLVTGPGRVLITEPAGDGSSGSFQLLEPAGSSLSHMRERLKEIKNDMRELGKMPLTSQMAGLTTITTAIAAGKAKTAIGQMCLNTESAIEQAFYITGLWLGNAALKAKAKLDRDFDEIDSNDVNKSTVTSMRRNGDLSQLSYWRIMQEYGVLPDDFDAENELLELSKESPNDNATSTTIG